MPEDAHSSARRIAAGRTTLSPGEMVGGKFRIERVVGRGGMGIVAEATNVQLGQKVALKLLLQGADDAEMVERFGGEARAAARLKSEHVARVYDVGTDERRGPFIVMEMLDGRTLGDVITTAGRVQLHRAVEYVIDACEGLAEAHARGIIHQDVKPANLFLVNGSDGRPTIKLLDFGIATMRTRGGPDPRSSAPSAGTPAYLAPEQLRASASQPVDHRADIWALGCVLYELLSGQRAFRAARFTELVSVILEQAPEALPDDVDIPEGVKAAILRCLEKDPERRFASTGGLALALLPFARRRAHTAVARAVSHVKGAGLDPTLEMPSSMPPRPSEDTIDTLSKGELRAPGVPIIDGVSTGVGLRTGAGNTSASRLAPQATTPPPRARRGIVPLAIVVGIALVLGAGFLAWTRQAPAPPPSAPVPTGASQAPAATTSAPPPEPTASSPPAAPTASASAGASAAAAPAPNPTVTPPAPRPFVPRPVAPRPTATPSARPPTAPDSEIRHTR